MFGSALVYPTPLGCVRPGGPHLSVRPSVRPSPGPTHPRRRGGHAAARGERGASGPVPPRPSAPPPAPSSVRLKSGSSSPRPGRSLGRDPFRPGDRRRPEACAPPRCSSGRVAGPPVTRRCPSPWWGNAAAPTEHPPAPSGDGTSPYPQRVPWALGWARGRVPDAPLPSDPGQPKYAEASLGLL